MRKLRTALPFAISLGSLTLQPALPITQPSSPTYEERDFLSRVRRLTIEGKRAGEGYWSPDGKRLVFQSEREPGNPFYQIYVLDFATGEAKRISPGIGKTTCAFFRPGTDEIEFASTHADPKSKQLQDEELAFRASGTPLGDALLAARGKRIHALGKLKADDYGGSLKVQLHLDDAALAGA